MPLTESMFADAWIVHDRRLYRSRWLLANHAPEPPIEVVRYYARELLSIPWTVTRPEHVAATDLHIAPGFPVDPDRVRIMDYVPAGNVEVVRIMMEELNRRIDDARRAERFRQYGEAFRHIASVLDRVKQDGARGRTTELEADRAVPRGTLLREPGDGGDRITMHPDDAHDLRAAVLRAETFDPTHAPSLTIRRSNP